MATYIRLRGDTDHVVNTVYSKILEAEEARFREYHAAVRIQAWFRATRVRQYIRYLHECATSIQKHWRGFLGRRNYRCILAETVDEMRVDHYHNMAIKIQKVWRGYFTRKYIYDYYSRKQYLLALVERNEAVRKELSAYEENQKREKQRENEQNYVKQQLEWAEKFHYLVSTYAQPGVFNSPYLRDPLPPESLLRLAKPKPSGKWPQTPRANKPLSQLQGYPMDAAWRSYPRSDGLEPHPPPHPPTKLPPLPTYKPQGPFKEPQEVRNQRYKPFKPSLRVETNFYSLEEAREAMRQHEWATRLHDDIFKPVHNSEPPYEPLLMTSGQFSQPDYGRKYFREVHRQRHVDGAFKTVVPPIHVFDKLNQEYLTGYVEQ